MFIQLSLAAAQAKARAALKGFSAIHHGSGATSALVAADTLATPAASTTASGSAASSHSTGPSSTTTSGSSERQIGEWQVPDLFDDNDEAVPSDVLVHRQAVQRSIDECFANELAASTLKAYDTALQEVLEAANSLKTVLLPMTSELQSFQCFGYLKSKHSDLKWSRVRTVRAAIMHWHKRRFTTCILDAWTSTLAGFWNGLSQSCSHASSGKRTHQFRQGGQLPGQIRQRRISYGNTQCRDDRSGVFLEYAEERK